jgi:hypothetical protein
VTIYGSTYSFHTFNHLYHVVCVVDGLSGCDACFWVFEEKDIALAKTMFDGRMPQVNGGSGSDVVVQSGATLWYSCMWV